jgi:hypothetical protein
VTDRTSRGGGRLSLVAFAVSFVLVLLSLVAVLASVRGFLESTRLLWLSVSLSVMAIVGAAASVLLARRS